MMASTRIAMVAMLLTLASVGAGAQGRLEIAPPCMNELSRLRTEAEKRAGTLRAAIEQKLPRPELCHLFHGFAEAEAVLLRYVVDRRGACNISPEALGGMKANHDRTLQVRGKVCAGTNGIPRWFEPRQGPDPAPKRLKIARQ